MLKVASTAMVCSILCAALVLAEAADPAPKRLRPQLTPEQRIARELRRLTGQNFDGNQTLIPITTDALTATFPHYLFYNLRYPVWPLELVPPRPLSSSNVIAVSPRGFVSVLTKPDVMQTFFNANRHRAQTDPQTILLAWLDLTWIFSEDGFFQFSVGQAIQVARQDDDWIASGKDLVQPRGGDEGEIDVTLTIAPRGRILSADETRNIHTGIRPICQATKLLDPDPIVRKMAEQCLLVMGSRAKPYLDAQRAKASPELQKAIDAIWLRMLERERTIHSTSKPTTRPATR